MKVHLVSCVGSEIHDAHLPHFIKHYRDIGIDEFHFIIHSETNSTELDSVKNYLKSMDVDIYLWVGKFNDSEKLRRITKILDEIGKHWTIVADADEFHDYRTKNVKDLFKLCEIGGINAIKGKLSDRASDDGVLKPVNPVIDIFKQYPVNIKPINDRCNDKVLAFKGRFSYINGGFHKIINKIGVFYHPQIFKVYHFKWTDKVLVHSKKLAETIKKNEYQYASELETIVKYFENNNGKLDINQLKI